MSSKKDSLNQFHETNALFAERTIELSGEVNIDMYRNLLKNLTVMDRSPGEIKVIVNSHGGDTIQGLAIYDVISKCKNHITGIVYGEASSSASFILQAMDTRIMMPHSYMMIHIGTEGHPEDHPAIVKNWRDFHDKVEKSMEDIYLNRIKKVKPRFTRNQLKSLLQFDKILLPKDAIELGLIDKIFEG